MNQVYNNVHVVVVQPNSNDEKICNFRVTVDADLSTHGGKEFTIKLTDDNDPTFYYSLILNEEDFVSLKNQQGLRVDFDNFPKQFGKLLNECKTREGQFRLVLSDSEIDESTYKLRAGCYLKVVESNDFKYLCHLSLRIAPGTENDIRRHLCNQLNSLQNQFLKLKTAHEQTLVDNETCLSDLHEKEKKITELEFRLTEERTAARLELSQQLGLEREKQAHERTELEVKHQQAMQELTSNVAILTHRNEILCKEKGTLDSDLRILALKNETIEKELNRSLNQNSELKETIRFLEDKVKNSEENLETIKRRLCSAEESRREMAGALSLLQTELESLREREKFVTANLTQSERRLQCTVAQLAKTTQKADSLEKELAVKNNQRENLLTIIKMLESEAKSSNDELLKKTEQLKSQEEADKSKTEELLGAKEKLEQLQKQLKEQEATIQRQIDVNSCLHRKLNQQELHNKTAPEVISSQRENLTHRSNRTLPPWLSDSSSILGVSQSSTLEKNLNLGLRKSETGLDPSYLMPAENSRKSSYFPTKK